MSLFDAIVSFSTVQPTADALHVCRGKFPEMLRRDDNVCVQRMSLSSWTDIEILSSRNQCHNQFTSLATLFAFKLFIVSPMMYITLVDSQSLRSVREQQ